MTDERQVPATVADVRADALAAVAVAIQQERTSGSAITAMAFLRLVAEHPHVLDTEPVPEPQPERPAEVEELVQLVGYPSARVRAREYGRPRG